MKIEEALNLDRAKEVIQKLKQEKKDFSSHYFIQRYHKEHNKEYVDKLSICNSNSRTLHSLMARYLARHREELNIKKEKGERSGKGDPTILGKGVQTLKYDKTEKVPGLSFVSNQPSWDWDTKLSPMKLIFLCSLLVVIAIACRQRENGKTSPPALKSSYLIEEIVEEEIDVNEEEIDVEDEPLPDPNAEGFDLVKYVNDYIKKHTTVPETRGEFETMEEWQKRIYKEKDKQKQELMHEALTQLYGNPFQKKVNLNLGQYNIDKGYFPMTTNGFGTYALHVSRSDGSAWRDAWNLKKGVFSLKYLYGLVDGELRLVYLVAQIEDIQWEWTTIYLIDEKTGKRYKFIWTNGAWIQQILPPPPKLSDLIDIVEDDFNKIDDDLEILDAEDQSENKEEQNVEDFEEEDDENIYETMEEEPQFPNGNVQKWISKNVKYPTLAMENGIQGKVFVQFVIERDGSITDVKVVRGVDPSLDKEAVRVVKAMPKWEPGKNKGKPVRVSYTLPINFQLTDDFSNRKRRKR